jgi:polysaccharide deacetylase family protein (PEP-CTERM system associated)
LSYGLLTNLLIITSKQIVVVVLKNILSIDLEDNYCDLPFSEWDRYESRINRTTQLILDLLEKYHTTATFFTVGYIAERHPEIIEDVKSRGHEIASHGYTHPDLRTMTKEEFETDLARSLEILRKVAGEPVIGFRAPYFSISKQNLWVFDIMKKFLKYDSSVFPVGPHYGFPNAPRQTYRVSSNDPLVDDPSSDFLEIPMATLRWPLVGNLPIAGGFHLRVLPSGLIRLGINKLNKNGIAAMCYIHPEDLASDRPRIPGYTWHYYYGLKGAAKKFESLLKHFQFTSAREVLAL